MLPRAAGDDETREGGEMGGMDLNLLGLGLQQPTIGGASSAQQPAWAPAAQASSPKLGSFRGVCSFQVPSTTTPSSDHQHEQSRAHGVATRASPLQMQRGPCCGTRPPPVAAGRRLIFEGSTSASAAARTWTQDDSTEPMTIIYAGSVRAYGGVTIELAEKILAMVAKEAQRAAGILADPHAHHQLELVAAPPTATGGDAALMTMHYWRLAHHHHVNDSLKRTASLARFLDKRKQRAEISAAATTMLRRDTEEWSPAQIAPAATVSTRTSASLGGMGRRPRASQDHPKRMKACHGEEEAVSTELRI